MTLAEHVERYVTFRRALGHAYVEQARCLQDYTTYAEARGDSFVRSSTVLDWASTTPSPRQAQARLRYVCDLASVLHADDERHEVPDRDALGKARSRRPSPHLLSLTEIRRIMDAALELPPAGSITPLTFHYILGLIAATGLRRSEATGLLLTDLTADGLLVRKAKFGKRRLVPLEGSVDRAMEAYLRERKRRGGPDAHLFVLSTGRPMHPVYLATVFVKLARRVGLRAGPGEPGPRLHDLRHSFAVRALESMLATERRGVGRHMLALSTYLGHATTADTYWYLEATPVLLRQVSQATERLHEGSRNDG